MPAAAAAYLPAAQLMQEVADVPADALNLPASQLMQLPAAAPEYFPTPQLMHTLAVVPEYLPASQLMQTLAAAAEYLPATQLMQDAADVPADALNLPAAQLMQPLAAGSGYLPGPQLIVTVKAALAAFVAPPGPLNWPAGIDTLIVVPGNVAHATVYCLGKLVAASVAASQC
jgi:hypothetical protein